MTAFPCRLPMLSKPHACRTVSRLLAASARRARCPFRDEDDTLAHALQSLALGRLGRGGFVFVVSDFLALPGEEAWQEALQRDWDIVPVVLHDPLWERCFLAICAQFDRLGLDPILLERHDYESVWRAFHSWAVTRRSGAPARV